MVNPGATVIVLDVGISMNKIYQTAFEDAKKCIKMIIQRKIFSESKDLIALILVGCDHSPDKEAENDSSEYENISIVQNLQPASWKLYELVNDIVNTDISTDYIKESALDIAINLLQNHVNVKKLDSKKILFMSNLDSYFDYDKSNEMCEELKANNIELNFINPVDFPEEIKSEIIDDSQLETKAKCSMLDLLKQANGEVYAFSDVSSALTDYEMKKVQPSPSNINLEIGTLVIPISVYIKTTESKPKTWSTACIHGDNEKPRRTTSYCKNDESQTVVSAQDTISAFKYGTTLVPYSEDDKKNMDYQPGEKGMKLLGFTKAEKIQRYLFIGDSTRYVFGQKNNESAKEVLAAFIEALHYTKMVAVARFVSTARSKPSIGFLSPRITNGSQCLAFVILPFMEDLRYFVFTSLESESKNKPTEEQLDAVDQLITAMDLTASLKTGDEEILRPKDTVNPYVQRLYQCLQHRALYPKKPLPPMELRIKAIVNPIPELLKRADESLKKIKSLFPIKEYLPKKLPDTKSSLFPNSSRELDEALSKDSVKEDALEAKFNVSDIKLVDAMTDKITQIGSINPVRDIHYLINNQVLPFDKICMQINEVTNKLLDDKDHLRYNYAKILSMIKEYRCSSLKEADCENYNSFMLSLQSRLLETNEELWDKIRNENIRLISKEELLSSCVSSEQAETFLSKPCSAKVAEESMEIAMPCDDDPDDLMDDL